MSPSWHNRLCIAISPTHISLFKLGRGVKSKLQIKHDEALDASAKQPEWQAMVDRLDTILGQPEWQNAEVEIVLSNCLVRYAAIPFDARLKDYPAQEAFARYYLNQTYGPVAGQWELRIQRGKAGKPWLIGAVDRALLEQLRKICATHGLKLRSVTPHLVSVLNCHSKLIKAELAWLVIHERGYSLFALLRDNMPIILSGVRHDSVQELPLLLDRENLVSAQTEFCKSIYLYAPSGSGISAMPKLGYEFNVLDTAMPNGYPSPLEGPYSMALGGFAKGLLQLDFQREVHVPRRLAGWLLLLTGLALLAELGFSYDKLRWDREAIYREVRTSKLRMDMPRDTPVIRRFTDEDFEKARQVIGRLSTPWDELFSGLESVSNENAAVLSIEPDVQTGILRIEGEAKDYAAVLTLIAQLRSTKPFAEVFLLRHEIKRDDPQHPVSFTLSLRWVKSL